MLYHNHDNNYDERHSEFHQRCALEIRSAWESEKKKKRKKNRSSNRKFLPELAPDGLQLCVCVCGFLQTFFSFVVVWKTRSSSDHTEDETMFSFFLGGGSSFHVPILVSVRNCIFVVNERNSFTRGVYINTTNFLLYQDPLWPSTVCRECESSAVVCV